jgi:hypothetical protein
MKKLKDQENLFYLAKYLIDFTSNQKKLPVAQETD